MDIFFREQIQKQNETNLKRKNDWFFFQHTELNNLPNNVDDI